MEETSALFVNLVAALAVAFVGAVVAVRLHQSPLLGYIVGGIIIGPHTPGFVADQATVAALAEIGIVFLLFAVGLDLSLHDLLKVGMVAIVGGLAQVAALIGIGYGVGLLIGWQPVESLFFGAVVAISSSTVISKILQERHQTDAEHGRIAFAWSTVQDLVTIALVVVLSTLARGSATLGTDLAWALGRSALFLALLVPIGLYVLPWVFKRVAALRNREVFVMSVGVVALGAAYASSLFGVSVALGAFVAGILVGESDLSHEILGEIQPLRDILAGLFFVSIGMLVDPSFVLSHAPIVATTVILIVAVKGAVTAGLVRSFGLSSATALLAGATLAQSAEFSFLLATVGEHVGAVEVEAFNAMLAGAALSTVLAPSLLGMATPLAARLRKPDAALATPTTALAVEPPAEQATHRSPAPMSTSEHALPDRTIVEAVLAEVAAFGQETDARETERPKRMLNITPDTGRLLRILARATGARRILEVGTSNGYSTLWLAWAAAETGGHVTTLERAADKARLARANFERAGLASWIALREGEALETLAAMDGPFDLIFLDADRPSYLAYADALLPLLRVGGLLVTDNVVSHASELTDFLARVKGDPTLDSVTVPVGNGEEITYKHA